MEHNRQSIWRLVMTGLVYAAALTSGLTACDPLGTSDNKAASAVFGRIAGSGTAGFTNGAHNVARFSNPVNVEVAADGRVYVADFDNDAIRVINSNGVVSTLVRGSTFTPPTTFSRPFGLTIAPDGTLYVQTDGNDMGMRDIDTGTIWRVNRTTGVATVVARDLGRPRGIQALDNNTLAMSDPEHHVISTLNLTSGVEETLAGMENAPGFVDDTGDLAQFDRPYGLALLSGGSSLLVADQNNHCLRQVTLPAGVVTTFAGICTTPGSGNGSVATATFNAPQDVAVSGLNVYVSDHDNFLIRRINGGTVFTQAGNGIQGFADGAGTAASFFGLEGIALDASGTTLWIADGNNGTGDPFNRVRRLAVP